MWRTTKIGIAVLLAIFGGLAALMVFHLGPRLGFGEDQRVKAHVKFTEKKPTVFIENFSTAYTAASPSAKRDMVIAAIDRGLIKRGMNLVETRQLFGAALIEHTRDSTNFSLSATVFFNPAIPAPKPMMSAIQEGWYCNFWFSSDDRLERYSLSNLHK